MEPSLSQVQAAVAALVERFARNADAYRRAEYKEAEVRHEFIEPFFAALGWDVHNLAGHAEAYKDVIHEESLRVAAGIEAPDYTFRIGGVRKFFVEAKKPAVSVKADAGPAYQLRRYAWSAKLPLSILTDFEEFAVYDCTQRPRENDKAGMGRVAYYTFDQYAQRLPEIWDVFAKEAILRGSFDRYAQDARKRRGTSEVDREILKEIEGWREALARNLALRNADLSVQDLNFAVQTTIDRILFLRVAEDRGSEEYGRLLALLNGEGTYARLGELYRQADAKYNSGLFDFRADTLTLPLQLDDRVLKDIIAGLYYPQSPYEFSMITADILGQVYEQFLGKVIRLTAGHHAVVDEKPEVKKAGGVYYTPIYIVDYIVQQTVGELVKDKTPQQVEKLRILDPACGSGSFLLGAYQYLLRYHLDWYVAHDPEKWAAKKRPPIRRVSEREWRLTTEEKKRILLNNIYGVDIDRQAVEVTKLNLLLKVLEGETQETLQLRLLQERALPDLGKNIQCGNSLIGPDYWQGKVWDEEEARRVNAFDWQAAFPQVMAAGGFDAVIGNPPYLKEANNKQTFDLLRNSAVRTYCVGKMDLWYVFACKALDLTRPKGLHSFIATNNWITSGGASVLRRKLLREAQILRYVDFADYKVFKTASIQTMIYVAQKVAPAGPYDLDYLKMPGAAPDESVVMELLRGQRANGDAKWTKGRIDPHTPESPFTIVTRAVGAVLDHIELGPHRYFANAEIGNGIDMLQDFVVPAHLARLHGVTAKPGDGIFVLTGQERSSVVLTENDASKLKPYYTPAEISRYRADPSSGRWIIYADRGVREHIDNYPGIKRHLRKFAPVLTSAFKPYGLHRPRDERFFTGRKILSIRKTKRPAFCLVDFPSYVSRAFLIVRLHGWKESDHYVLGILNSSVAYYWLYHRGKKQGDQLQVDKEPLTTIPLRTVNFHDPADVARHDCMVSLVERMLELHKLQAAARTPADRELYARQIQATDREIDALVYELYGLTEEEIAVVEGAVNG